MKSGDDTCGAATGRAPPVCAVDGATGQGSVLIEDDASWSQGELARLACVARRDSLARDEMLQAFQAGADFYAPLSSRNLDDAPFVAPGDCVAAIVIRELTGAGEAEAWLHTFLRAHELRQDLPPPLSAACKGKRRF